MIGPLRRGSSGRPPGLALSVDPSIESLQLRQRVEVLRGWRNLLLSLFVLVGAIAWLVLAPGTRLEAGIATSLATGLAGIQLDRLLEARRGRDDFYRDVITLTSIFYQSPATIRDFLGQDSIERSIANLLKAALDSDELGAAYWQQSVRPFIAYRDRGFKEDWCYSIDLRDLQDALEVQVAPNRDLRFDPSEYRRLTTSLVYNQTVLEPADVYWVACAFDPHTIPAWFREPNYLLREIVPLPSQLRQILREALPAASAPSGAWWRGAPRGGTAERERARRIAGKVFDASVRIDGEELPAHEVFADHAGIRWGFALSGAQQETLRRSLEIRVEVQTLQPRTHGYFPVAINAPTRHPTVRFNYGMCKTIGEVRSEVFFSAERPYEDSLRVVSRENRRIEVETKQADWVMAGSGCVFVWDDPPRPASHESARAGPQALDRSVAPGTVRRFRQ